MKRVFKSFLTVGIATAMLGLVVSQARAERIIISGGCVSLSCVPDSLTVNAGSLSFGGSSVSVDTATASSVGLAFAYQVAAGSDRSEQSVARAVAPTAARISIARDTKNSVQPNAILLSDSMLWSFSGARAMNASQSVASLALPTANGRSEGFSVVAAGVASVPTIASASAKAGTFHAQGSGGGSLDGGPPGGAPSVPEPATMLLFGSGLVGAAAVLRKQRRNRREDSK